MPSKRGSRTCELASDLARRECGGVDVHIVGRIDLTNDATRTVGAVKRKLRKGSCMGKTAAGKGSTENDTSAARVRWRHADLEVHGGVQTNTGFAAHTDRQRGKHAAGGGAACGPVNVCHCLPRKACKCTKGSRPWKRMSRDADSGAYLGTALYPSPSVPFPPPPPRPRAHRSKSHKPRQGCPGAREPEQTRRWRRTRWQARCFRRTGTRTRRPGNSRNARPAAGPGARLGSRTIRGVRQKPSYVRRKTLTRTCVQTRNRTHRATRCGQLVQQRKSQRPNTHLRGKPWCGC
jgi:hypothetical protein